MPQGDATGRCHRAEPRQSAGHVLKGTSCYDPAARPSPPLPLMKDPAARPLSSAPPPEGARCAPRAATPERVSPERLGALVALLDDPSPAVWEPVRDHLERAGRAAVPALRRAASHPEPRVRLRSRALLATHARRATLRRLAATLARDPVDLEAGLWRLARAADPEFDAREARIQLDRLAARVRARGHGLDAGMAKALALVDVLCEEDGLRGAEDGYHHPDNAHLGRVLERRRGLPLSLVAIHLLVARRAGIRAAAVPLPGHVMLRLYAGERSLLVDPFHGGKIRTRKDCLTYLLHQGLAPRTDWFADATDRQLLLRQTGNLINGLRLVGRSAEAHALKDVLRAVEPRPRSSD